MKKAEDLARSISKRLSNHAKEKNVAFADVLTAFLIERMVLRLSQQPSLGQSLVFKGGYVALRIYESSRYTIDLDAVLKKGNIDATIKDSISAIETDLGDAVWFKHEATEDLKAQTSYGGKCCIFRSGIGPILKDLRRAQIVNFDIGIGDPITPGPVGKETPFILGEGTLNWQVYPIETAAAEKLHTLIIRGSANSRTKDVFDLSLFLNKCNRTNLQKALENTFKFRGDDLPKDIYDALKKIDTTILERGWIAATADIESAPSFKAAFSNIVEYFK
jgi:predicted nucleotidyltransferase component of viral defense system